MKAASSYAETRTSLLEVTQNISLVHDLLWRDSPSEWHQQLAQVIAYRFSTFDELEVFARNAKRAGVSALILTKVHDMRPCAGSRYNELQLCAHINGSYPVPDGSLEQWQMMVRNLRPMRLMWRVNMACDPLAV